MDNSLIGFFQGFSVPAVILLLAGIGLLVGEFFTPGFGVSGVMGIICLGACICLRAESVGQALIMIIVLLIIVGVLFALFIKSATNGRISKTDIVNTTAITASSDYAGSENLERFVGKTGISRSILRPAGIADFNGERIDVVTDGSFVDKGAKVVVSRTDGRRVVVEEVK